MMYEVRKIDANNQVTIPDVVLDSLGLAQGERLVFTKTNDGQIILSAFDKGPDKSFLMVDAPPVYKVNPKSNE